MFGTNPLRKQELLDNLWVQEVFHTIQGEGPSAGTPAVFVRLAGCNLKCWFCDTDFESSSWKPSVGELVDKIKSVMPITTSLVVITGGEPFRQNLFPLLTAILADGSLRVEIETAGTLHSPEMEGIVVAWERPSFANRVRIICSPKTPILDRWLERYIFAYKYIIRVGEVALDDGLPINNTQVKGKTSQIARPPVGFLKERIFVQACDEYDAEKNKRNQILAADVAMEKGYRLSVQVHKLVNLP